MRDNRFGARRLAVCLLLLILTLVFSGCFPATRTGDGTDPATDRGTTPATAFVELLSASDGIPAFNRTVLKRMHVYYTNFYVGELGTVEETVAAIVDLYHEYRNLIDETDPNEVTDLLCECYLAAVGDKYAYYMNAEAYAEYDSDLTGNYVGIGVQVTNNSLERTITITAVFPNTPAFEAGLLTGDTIERVGDASIADLSFAEVVNRIRGEEGTDVTVTFGRNGETFTRTMTRRSVTQVTSSASMRSGTPKIGVVRITEFDDPTAPQFKTALDGLLASGAEGLVFDLRNNPGGLLTSILSILDYFVPDGTPLASYLYYDGERETDYADDGHEIPASVPIAVLCNEYTASAGELFTCAMQDYGKQGLLDVKVVGTVTYGKGTMQTLFFLSKGEADGGTDDMTRATTVSIAYYDPPYSGNYEGVGVIPDVSVDLSEEAKAKSVYVLTEEEDTQMQAAIASVAERIR